MASNRKITSFFNSPVFFWVLFAVILLSSFYNAFSHLADGGIYEWDEARHGVNAYEMIQDKNYILHTYDGEPDYWNVKPPFSMWAIALSYKIWGYNIFALRFFSALALPIIVCISMIFTYRFIGRYSSIITGALFAFTGTRFHHLFKTGDPDALFFLFCLLACIFLYLAIIKQNYYLIGCGLSISIAFLIKAMHIAPLVFVVITVLILTRKIRRFTMKELGLYLFVPVLCLIITWALMRYSQDQMIFFQNMLLLDVLNRVSTAVEGHAGGWGYYLIVLYNLIGPWVFWGILAAMTIDFAIEITSKHNPPKDQAFIAVFLSMLIWPIVIFTFSTTKLGWYVYPSLIGIYFMAGYCIQRIVSITLSRKKRTGLYLSLAFSSLLILVGLCIVPDKDIHRNASPSSDDSIWMEIKDVGQYEEALYYTVSTSGAEFDQNQSWLLYTQFNAMHHTHGNLDDFIKDEAALLLLVHFESEESIQEFYRENSSLHILVQNNEYALFSK